TLQPVGFGRRDAANRCLTHFCVTNTPLHQRLFQRRNTSFPPPMDAPPQAINPALVTPAPALAAH
ncbi:MAG TPA: hypothetical protein QGI62_08060, partial [Anaerolineales bacterium]|nr:hypothetical protein [Anaerolineales bacterium]